MSEVIDRRILGAVEFVEANTGLPIGRPLQIQGTGATFYRNRRGQYVITRAAGFEEYGRTFENAPAAAAATLTLQVLDPGGRYLPQQATIDLPRDPDPASSDSANSLFRPRSIELFPAPAASPAPGWALIYASVRDGSTQAPLGGALLRVLQNGSTVLARGLTAWRGRIRGEALVTVPGLPVTISGDDGDGDGLVIVDEIALTLEAIVDPAFDPETGWPDPADLEARRDSLPLGTAGIALASGRTIAASVSVTI